MTNTRWVEKLSAASPVRRLVVAVICALALLRLPAAAEAQSALDGFGESPGFDAPAANDDVLALALWDNPAFPTHLIVVGGSFTEMDGRACHGIAFLRPHGGAGGCGQDAGVTVRALAVQPDGDLLVGGSFSTLFGQARTNLARLDQNGVPNPTFVPNLNGEVHVLAVQPDGKILVGGDFTQVDGQARNHIARLNADGSLDTSFNPGASDTVRAFAIQPDGGIVVGGGFTTLGGGGTGTSSRSHIGRLHPDGSLDTSFDPGASSWVYALALQPDGKIMVGGSFTSLAKSNHPVRLARLNHDGSLDGSYSPENGPNGTVWTLAVQPDGTVLLGGDFTQFDSSNRSRIARSSPTGTHSGGWDTSTSADDRVTAMLVQPDGNILMGGRFTTVNGVQRLRVARLYPDGPLDATLDQAATDDVYALAQQADGKILVGGKFTMLGGQTRNRIARLDAGGQLDNFDPSMDGDVFALAVQPDGKILVGGEFTSIDGQTRNRIARLSQTGFRDTTFDPGANDAVLALAVQPDGKILMGGEFTKVGGGHGNSVARNFLARVDPDGTVDPGFNPGPDFEVVGLAVQTDGKILIWGEFGSVAGGSRTGVARLNPDGSLDTGFDPATNDEVLAVAVQPDGKILIGGEFTSVGGQPRAHLARLHPDGTLDTSFLATPGDLVLSLAIQADGQIIVGGDFRRSLGDPRDRLMRVSPDGALDTSFDPEANDIVRALAIQPDGKILVGGDFTNLDVEQRLRIGRLTNSAPAFQSLDLIQGRTGIRWTRSGSSPALASVLFEQSLNGSNYTRLGDGTYSSGGWELTGLVQARLHQLAGLAQGPLYIRARGSVSGGLGNASGSLHESVRFVFADTTTTTLTSSTNPSVAGQPVTLTATVVPATPALGTPTGSVSFLDGGTVLADHVPLDAAGQASTVTSGLAVGARTLTAIYNGDLTFVSSSDAVSQTVNPAATVTTITSDTPDPSAVGQPLPVGYSVAVVAPGAGTPTGTVMVSDGTATCSAPVAAGSCNLIPTTTGAKALTATYGGDANFVGSSGTATHSVTTAVSVTVDGLANGASITYTSPFLDLSGTASSDDALRAASIASVTWENDRGGSGVAEGTTTWRAPFIPLQPGANSITIKATDDTGETASASITATVTQLLYYLAEGATGPFFDLDLLLGNSNPVAAPVTITFLKEDGSTIGLTDTLTANSQRTISVNGIPGLATAAVSTVVSSDSGLPLTVERSMLWDASVPAPRVGEEPGIASGATHYGGHTAKAVDSPRTRWLFAEGSQGFFDTYLLLANANATPANVTVTYLVEGGAPVVQNVTVGATSRLTLFAGAVAQLVGASFGIVVDASQPIIAERAMYFSAGRFWEGGHESAGVPEASTSWFHAEGATGSFFDTFILVSNSNGVPANLVVNYLLASGAAIPKNYVVPANGRITINVETQDPQLADAAVSTTVTSDVPVISERAMYWVGGFTTWYEAHNSFGVTATGTKWGLAEGRVGTSTGYQTFILLANPAATAAQVRITYLRTNGTTVVESYTVPPTSRFNVWVNTEVPELVDESFGALIEVTNGVEIAVERALYWDDGGQTWGGGTNATAVRLP